MKTIRQKHEFLVRFLKQENLLDKYKAQYELQSTFGKDFPFDKISYIEEGFLFRLTPEGAEYWRNVMNKFNSALKKYASPFDDIINWGANRNLHKEGDIKTQYCKLGEEFGELGRAIIKSDNDAIIDAIGDMVIVLTNLTEIYSINTNTELKGFVTMEYCINEAYNVIKNRKGSMENGSFIKD